MSRRDEVIRMAREADCQHVNLTGDRAAAVERLTRFAALVAAAERERCANACEGFRHGLDSRSSQAEGWAAAQCAEAIRALKP